MQSNVVPLAHWTFPKRKWLHAFYGSMPHFLQRIIKSQTYLDQVSPPQLINLMVVNHLIIYLNHKNQSAHLENLQGVSINHQCGHNKLKALCESEANHVCFFYHSHQKLLSRLPPSHGQFGRHFYTPSKQFDWRH